MLFSEAPAFCDTEILKQFLQHCTSICISSLIMSQIFKILFQTGDIDNFVFRGVFFGRHVPLKISFSDKKKPSDVKSETHFRRQAIKL